MVDLSKHLTRAKQAVDKRAYDLALEITTECQEVDPSNIDNYQILIDAAKRRIREGGKKGMGLRLGFSKDPHKQMSGAVKAVAKNPDLKNLMAAGDAATKLGAAGTKNMHDVAILFYQEAKATGLFNKDLLWNLGQAYYQRFEATKEPEALESAIQTMAELQQGDPSHGEAARTAKNWEAMRSMSKRRSDGDYRSQLADSKQANRQELMNRIIRTPEDAKAVLEVIADELKQKPEDKALWLKKGDIHRRMQQFDDAEQAYQQAAQLDSHDFVVTMRLGDVKIARLEAAIRQAQQAGQDIAELQRQLLETEIAEYRNRVQNQPTEQQHRFALGQRLFKVGDVDAAATEFQQAVKDPRFKRQCHTYLGHCFAKKGLLDLSQKQFTEAINQIEDKLSDDYKETLYNRARVCEAKGDSAQAIDDYTRLVEIDLSYKDAAQRLNNLQ